MKDTAGSSYVAEATTRQMGDTEYQQPTTRHHYRGSLAECLNFLADLATNAAVRVETASVGRILAEYRMNQPTSRNI